MPRYAQLVMGPAGSGKSTYCCTMQKHYETLNRSVQVINLDPAAEEFHYTVMADVRDLISVEDAMEDDTLRYGPNGGLVFCMEYLAENFDWLHEQIDDIDDDYIIFDCPGQIELYTHIPVMRNLVDQLQQWDFRICGVYLIDSQFMIEPSKFVSGMLTALSTMVNLEIPHVTIMSKLDLLSKKAKKDLDRYLEPDLPSLLNEDLDQSNVTQKFAKLNSVIAQMIDDYSLVKFFPLDQTDEDSVNDICLLVDNVIQYGEDLEPKEPKDLEEGEDNPDDS